MDIWMFYMKHSRVDAKRMCKFPVFYTNGHLHMLHVVHVLLLSRIHSVYSRYIHVFMQSCSHVSHVVHVLLLSGCHTHSVYICPIYGITMCMLTECMDIWMCYMCKFPVFFTNGYQVVPHVLYHMLCIHITYTLGISMYLV